MGLPPTIPGQGDPGDENDNVQQEIEELEARVSAIEQKLGIQSPADEDDDPLKAAIAGTKGAFGS